MSDGRVRAAIEQMEAWLADQAWEPDAEALAQWNAEFQSALAQAEKASGWPELINRAHAAGKLLDTRLVQLTEEQDRVRAELKARERGTRALKGYETGTR